jgi:hypothetical protein
MQVEEVDMQPFAFNPWAWRDPTIWGGYDPTGDQTLDTGKADSIAADERTTSSLAGYHVEASDGSIGSIDEASDEVGNAYLVVDTGPWIFGRKVLLPAGTVQRVDHDDRRVYVDRTKEQIKNSPEYEKETFDTPEYRERVGVYYGETYRDAPPAR